MPNDQVKAEAALPHSLTQERQRYQLMNQQRRGLLPKAFVVGVLAGLTAVGFHIGLDKGEQLRGVWLANAHVQGWLGLSAVIAVTMALIVLSAYLVKALAPEAGGSGIPHIKGVLQGHKTFHWLRVLLVKFASGLIGISAGMALGREGPTVQMGAAWGQAVSGMPPTRQHEHSVLVAAGSAAGLSAAFNTPLAGLVFVLEELQGRFASLEFYAAAVACFVADMVCRSLLGQQPVFHLPTVLTPDLKLLPGFVCLGLASGLFGVLFNQLLLAGTRLNALSFQWRLLSWLMVGAMVGLSAWYEADWVGGGQRFLDSLFSKGLASNFVASFFLMRFVLTLASYSTGAAGGIFSPILVLGAVLGVYFENLIHLHFPELDFGVDAFAVVGMAAFFTAVVRAPLTGIVLMIEMTGNYSLILPLFAASFAALTVADGLNDLPIYEALLERDLKKSHQQNP